MRSYAIGDIHGHLDLLKRLHDRIAADQATHGAAPIVHLGDLVDRGPNSRGVVEYLRHGQVAGEDWVVLKGNHDRMFALYLTGPDAHDPGLRPEYGYLHPRIGGIETLASYGVADAGARPAAEVLQEASAAVPAVHRRFLETLPGYHQRGDVIFVHAGIRPGVPLAQQTETDLVWIRDAFLNDRRDHGALIVHGHTHIDAPRHYGNRVNLDSGAAYGGPLSAVVIEGREVFHLTDRGRVPLRPR